MGSEHSSTTTWKADRQLQRYRTIPLNRLELSAMWDPCRSLRSLQHTSKLFNFWLVFTWGSRAIAQVHWFFVQTLTEVYLFTLGSGSTRARTLMHNVRVQSTTGYQKVDTSCTIAAQLLYPSFFPVLNSQRLRCCESQTSEHLTAAAPRARARPAHSMAPTHCLFSSSPPTKMSPVACFWASSEKNGMRLRYDQFPWKSAPATESCPFFWLQVIVSPAIHGWLLVVWPGGAKKPNRLCTRLTCFPTPNNPTRWGYLDRVPQ